MPTRYILLISSVLSLILSATISIVPIGIYNQAEVSALLPTLFTPATFTFSIWSVIYLSWIVLGIYVAVRNIHIPKKQLYLLGGAQILSSLWLIPSQYLWIGISLIVMFGVLGLLSILAVNMQKSNTYFRYTTELFFGWILVACIANIHLVLVYYDLYYFPEILTYISIITALCVNICLLKYYKYFIVNLVLIWSLTGIIIGQSDGITQILCYFAFSLIIFISIKID